VEAFIPAKMVVTEMISEDYSLYLKERQNGTITNNKK
jgi:hypothetical protein